MSRDSITLEKSRAFAIRIVNLYKFLSNYKKEYVLSKQVLFIGLNSFIRQITYLNRSINL